MTESMDEIHRRIDGLSGPSPDGYAIAKSAAQADRLIQMALDALAGGGTRTDAIIYLNDARAHHAAVFAKLREAKS